MLIYVFEACFYLFFILTWTTPLINLASVLIYHLAVSTINPHLAEHAGFNFSSWGRKITHCQRSLALAYVLQEQRIGYAEIQRASSYFSPDSKCQAGPYAHEIFGPYRLIFVGSADFSHVYGKLNVGDGHIIKWY